MTGRLLGRCTRLLSRAHGAQAAAAAAASSVAAPRLPAAPLNNGLNAELLRPRGPLWRGAPGRPLCERAAAAAATSIPSASSSSSSSEPSEDRGQIPVMPKRTRLDDLVERATAAEDVLQAWSKHGGDANHAAHAVAKLARLQREGRSKGRPVMDGAELLADPRLQHMMATINEQVTTVWNGALVNAMRALRALGVPFGNAALRSVHTDVLWRIRRLSAKHLAFLVEWGAGLKGPHEEALMSAAFKQLELHWTEISDVKTVRMLISQGRHMSPALMDKLEDKALELSENFSAEDIRRVCLSLAAQGSRSVPLLRAMSYHLLQKPSSELGTPLLLDMAYVYGKLNFHHSQLFQRMLTELLPRVPELSPADVTRCAKSLGFLKLLHYPMFEAFSENYMANSVKYSTSHLCNLIMTLARLGFQPTKSTEFYHQVHGALDQSLPDLEPFLQTDVVWSLCVLQQAKTSHLTALTQHVHTAKVTGDPSRAENYRQKLLQIAATLRLEHPPQHPSSSSSSSVPLLLASAETPKSTSVSPLQSSLMLALQSLVGATRTDALRTAVDTVYGWTIDGELVVDFENKPIGLSSLTAPHLTEGGKDGQPLPGGARRLAFLAWDFPNFGSRSKELLGRFVMKRRHLQLAGFIIVEVPYYEWMELKSDWQRLAYLKDKIGKAVAEDMAK